MLARFLCAMAATSRLRNGRGASSPPPERTRREARGAAGGTGAARCEERFLAGLNRHVGRRAQWALGTISGPRTSSQLCHTGTGGALLRCGDGNRLLLRLTARARRYGAQRGVAAPALFSLSDGRGDGGDGESRTGILIKDRGTTAAPGASDDRDRGPPVSEPAPRRRAAAAASTGAMQTGPDGVAELLQRAAAVGAQPCQRRVERRAAGVTAHMGQVGPVARVGGEGGELEGGGRGKGLRRLGRAESLRL